MSFSRHISLVSTVVLLLSLSSGTAFAEDGDSKPAEQADEKAQNSLESGKMSISIGVPSGGNPYNSGAAGFWYVVNSRIKVGGSIGIALDTQPVYEIETDNSGEFDEFDKQDDASKTKFDVLLAPTIQYYLLADGPVTPYVFGQVNMRKMFDGNDKTTPKIKKAFDDDEKSYNANEQFQLGVTGGIGVEWFIVEQFSLNGHVGLGVDILRQAQLEKSSGPGQPPKKKGKGLAFGTFTSGIAANFYF